MSGSSVKNVISSLISGLKNIAKTNPNSTLSATVDSVQAAFSKSHPAAIVGASLVTAGLAVVAAPATAGLATAGLLLSLGAGYYTEKAINEIIDSVSGDSDDGTDQDDTDRYSGYGPDQGYGPDDGHTLDDDGNPSEEESQQNLWISALDAYAMHHWGYCNYKTRDESRNLWWMALLFWGEGWHNNHHARPGDWNFRKRWWEFDIGAVVITVLGLRTAWADENASIVDT